MGFLSVLGKIAGAVTGLGGLAGKQEEGAAKGKFDQATLQQRQDQNAIQLYQAQQQAQQQQALTDLQRQQFAQQNRGATAKQALIGALIGGGMTPTSIGPSGASGGIFRSLMANPEALAAMKTMGSQASGAQNTPLSFAGGQMVTAPKLTPLPQIDKGGFMSALARVAQFAGPVMGLAGSFAPEEDKGGYTPAPYSAAAGVNPFYKPPTAKLLYGDEGADGSNG